MSVVTELFRAGLKRFNLKPEKNEFIPYEQMLKPNPNPKSPKDCFVNTGKGGAITRKTLLAEGFTDAMIKDLIGREVLHVVKVKKAIDES